MATARQVRLTINGNPYEAVVEPRMTLADFLRHELGLTGTHVGCEHGVCGACTVILNGQTVRSCLMLAVQADGRAVGRIGEHRIDAKLSGLHVNPAVELNTGRALGRAGSTPIMIVHRAGRGRAILMNFTMASFPNLSLPETDVPPPN